MWAEALDLMMARLAASGLDIGRLAAISGSAQQHGSVYLNVRRRQRVLAALDPARPLAAAGRAAAVASVAPIWMDSSTAAECAAIAAAVGGDAVLAARTGSRAFERFTGPQIRKFCDERARRATRATDRMHLVSSFLASLLAGACAGRPRRRIGHEPDGPRDRRVVATPRSTRPRPDSRAGCRRSRRRRRSSGRLSPYWQARHGLPAAKVVVWSGDNPCSLIGVGLVREGRVAISLGTSDTVFGLMTAAARRSGGTGHVFGAPTGDYMGLTCFSNGSLARERVRDAYGLTWAEFSRALEATPPGNDGRVLLPWFEPEITPPVAGPACTASGSRPTMRPANVRGVVEAQHDGDGASIRAGWASTIDTIHATGGAAVNPQILQVMADVFGADVYRFRRSPTRPRSARRCAPGTPTRSMRVVRCRGTP